MAALVRLGISCSAAPRSVRVPLALGGGRDTDRARELVGRGELHMDERPRTNCKRTNVLPVKKHLLGHLATGASEQPSVER